MSGLKTIPLGNEAINLDLQTIRIRASTKMLGTARDPYKEPGGQGPNIFHTPQSQIYGSNDQLRVTD